MDDGESLISHALRNALEHDANDILISIGDDESLGQAIQANIIDTLSNKEKEKSFYRSGFCSSEWSIRRII